MKALRDEKMGVSTTDYYPDRTETGVKNPVLKNKPPNVIRLPASKRPFSLSKNVLRKLDVRRDLYFYASDFYEDKNNIVFCEGKVFQKKMVGDGETRAMRFLKHNDSIFALASCFDGSCVYVCLNDLHFSNYFFFKHNDVMYLLEWIY